MSVLAPTMIVVAFIAAVWWIVARNYQARALQILSVIALALGILVQVSRDQWQVVPWELVALLVALAAAVRWRVPGFSHRWIRVTGRIGLIGALLAGGLALLTVAVPVLPEPNGSHLVGTQVFRWIDVSRAETFTLDPNDKREVIAQAWYPAQAASAQRAAYFEAQGRLPGSVSSVPAWFYQGFGAVDSHATVAAPISTDRGAWPVLFFLTGLSESRESYSALCADLASRGYVVVALSVPYESTVSVLADGRIVGQTVDPFGGTITVPQLIDVRVADSRFALDQLGRLAQVATGSPLIGHLDLQHVAVVGHSVGGATAIQVLAADPRFKAGVNIDGTLFGTESSTRLNQPLLWLQSDGGLATNYEQSRNDIFSGMRGGGDVLIVRGSVHEGFTDVPGYFTPTGRAVIGSLTAGSVSLADMTAMTGGAISAFMGPLLGGPTDPTLAQVLVRYPAIQLERHVAASTTATP